jgi:hypothetical protein
MMATRATNNGTKTSDGQTKAMIAEDLTIVTANLLEMTTEVLSRAEN